jgi:hypothetical protein
VELPDFLVWPEFNSMRTRMGAPLANRFGPNIKIATIDLPVIERLRKGGIDVDIDEVRVLDDGTLAFKDYRVLLYIRDVNSYSGQQQMPRFHLTFCSTLQQMRQNKRFARYVVANRDDGLFQVNLVGKSTEPSVLELNVCKNCLTHLNWKDYRTQDTRAAQDAIVRKFVLTDFFAAYPQDLVAVKPIHTSETAPLNTYPPDWAAISQAARQAAHFRCAKCTIVLRGTESKYLHAHHKNGQKNDSRPDNLEVLCVRCHSNEPLHGHLKASDGYLTFVKRFPS